MPVLFVLLSITYNSILVDEREIKRMYKGLNSKRLPHIAFSDCLGFIYWTSKLPFSRMSCEEAPTITEKLPGSTVN